MSRKFYVTSIEDRLWFWWSTLKKQDLWVGTLIQFFPQFSITEGLTRSSFIERKLFFVQKSDFLGGIRMKFNFSVDWKGGAHEGIGGIFRNDTVKTLIKRSLISLRSMAARFNIKTVDY